MHAPARSIPYATTSDRVLGWMRRHPLVAFFVLAFGFTWAIEIPMQVFQLAPLQLVVGWRHQGRQEVGPGVDALVQQRSQQHAAAGAVEEPGQDDPRADRTCQEQRKAHVALRTRREEQWEMPGCPEHPKQQTGGKRALAHLQPR